MPVRKRKHTEFLESFEPEISGNVKLQTQTHSKSSKKRASSSSPLKPVGQAGFQRPAFQPVILRPFKRRISTDLPKESFFQVFQLFCPVHLVQQWVEFINLRHISLPGRAEGPRSKYSRYNTWDPTSVDEIYLFLGILIYMSVHQEPAVIDYWSTSPTDPIHPITRFMPRNRFQALYRRFCIWDPTETKSTVFQKVAEWSQYIQLRSIEYWKPASSVSIDEAMVRFTGRSKDTVHLPSKPIPIGYKVWVVADSGYFLQWSFHRKGYGPVNYDAIPSLGLAPTQGIVADLLRRLPPPPSTSHGYHCYMDNLFATPQLFEYLRSQGIAATGTTRPARIDSNQLQKLRTQESRRDTIPWGTLYARKCKEAEVIQFGFKDNAFVLLLSTAFNGMEPECLKLRRQPSKTSTSARTARVPFDGQPLKLLPIPQLINSYNQHMNSVDIGDQLRAGFTPRRRIARGGQQALVYLFLLEVVVTNTYLLQQHGWPSDTQVNSQTTFRKRLYTEIFGIFGKKLVLHDQRSQAKKTEGMPIQTTIQPHSLTTMEKRGWCAWCSSKKQRLVLNTPVIRKVERNRYITTGCSNCGVHLCRPTGKIARECWKNWHAK